MREKKRREKRGKEEKKKRDSGKDKGRERESVYTSCTYDLYACIYRIFGHKCY
jgi:hypothetical protein